MPTTANKGLEVQTTGSNSGSWGTVLNDDMISLLDTMLGGSSSISLSSSNVLLSQTQAQTALLRLTGTLTANVVLSPDAGVLMTGFYYFENLTTGSFSVTLSNSGGSVVLPQSRRGIVWIDTANGPRIIAIVGSSSADPIPVGTVMLFYQNAAPTGWTIDATLNDYALKIVNGSGGVVTGSVPYSTLFGRTATDSTTLTSNQIPSHQHFIASTDTGATTQLTSAPTAPVAAGGAVFTGGTNVYYYVLAGGVAAAATIGPSSATGGGAGHTHAIDMQVRTASIILARKA